MTTATIVKTSSFNLVQKLSQMKGHKFIAYTSEIDMLAIDKRGGLTKMNKRGNPWVGKTLIKRSKASASVGFSYDKKVERRDGDEPETKGNYQQALIVNGFITPLSTHKGDILVDNTELPWAEQKAMLDDNGTVVITAPQPRLYLRFEIMRDNGEGERSERKMRSDSNYFTQNELGAWEEVDKDLVTPYLKKRGPRKDKTDFQLLTIGNLKTLSIDGEKIELI